MSVSMVKVAYVNLYLQEFSSDNDSPTSPPIQPYIEDLNSGWVGTGNGVWTYENPTKSYSDIYEVLRGHKYWLTLGDTVGTRFRVMFSTVDVSTITLGTIKGTAVNTANYNNPAPHQNLFYTPESNGYIIIQKDNIGISGIKTYLYDLSSPHVFCCPLGSVNTDTCDNPKIMQIVNSIRPILPEAMQLIAVKKIEGYKFIVI